MALGADLKATLETALAEGGPEGAIRVCRHEGPGIAAAVSEQARLSVSRTALRVRNPANSASGWQREVMEAWLRDLVSGQSMEELEYFQQDQDGSFRYMRPIATGALCLVCHGGSLEPGLERAILDAYPQDRARGFQLGELRGAFVVEGQGE